MIANTVRSHTHTHTRPHNTSHDLTTPLVRIAISTRTYSNCSIGLSTAELLNIAISKVGRNKLCHSPRLVSVPDHEAIRGVIRLSACSLVAQVVYKKICPA